MSLVHWKSAASEYISIRGRSIKAILGTARKIYLFDYHHASKLLSEGRKHNLSKFCQNVNGDYGSVKSSIKKSKKNFWLASVMRLKLEKGEQRKRQHRHLVYQFVWLFPYTKFATERTWQETRMMSRGKKFLFYSHSTLSVLNKSYLTC